MDHVVHQVTQGRERNLGNISKEGPQQVRCTTPRAHGHPSIVHLSSYGAPDEDVVVEACANDDPLGRAVLYGRHSSAVALHHAFALQAVSELARKQGKVETQSRCKNQRTTNQDRKAVSVS